MNYQEYKKLQEKSKDRPVHQSRPDKPARPLDWDKFWNFLSNIANPSALLAVISMFVFGFKGTLHLPEIPAFFCFLTCFLFLVRSKVKNSFEWLTLLWLFNALIWTMNFIFLT
jgi:hypothetical protein